MQNSAPNKRGNAKVDRDHDIINDPVPSRDLTHHFSVAVAKQYGIEAAVLVENFRFWVNHNLTNGRNHHDGRTWIYNSARAFALQFSYMSEGQIRRTIGKLVKEGVIITGNFNKSWSDRTTWYAFADERKWLPDPICQKRQMHSPELTNDNSQICRMTTAGNDKSTSTDQKQQIENTDTKSATTSGEEVDVLISLWEEAYRNKFGHAFVVSKKDRAAAKRLLNNGSGYKPKDIVGFAKAAWRSKSFFGKKAVTPHLLDARWSEIAAEVEFATVSHQPIQSKVCDGWFDDDTESKP